MKKLKINIIPPVEGGPADYSTEEAHDATSVPAWLKKEYEDGILTDCNGKPVHSDTLHQLDAGEYHYHRAAPEQGERHTAPKP